jgi:hypothetical protein
VELLETGTVGNCLKQDSHLKYRSELHQNAKTWHIYTKNFNWGERRNSSQRLEELRLAIQYKMAKRRAFVLQRNTTATCISLTLHLKNKTCPV